jgi:hypothetical protein
VANDRLRPVKLDQVQPDLIRNPVDVVGILLDKDPDCARATIRTEFPRLTDNLASHRRRNSASRFGEDQAK